MSLGYEVHEHCFVSGPRACTGRYRFSHSHEGGSTPHEHPDTGPASYSIDKDEWFRATGLRGGGRKRYTSTPTGEQLPARALAPWQGTFKVVVLEASPEVDQGPGLAPAARMILGFRMAATIEGGGL